MLILCNTSAILSHVFLSIKCSIIPCCSSVYYTVITSIHETLLRCSKYLPHLFTVKCYLDFDLSVLIRQKSTPPLSVILPLIFLFQASFLALLTSLSPIKMDETALEGICSGKISD